MGKTKYYKKKLPVLFILMLLGINACVIIPTDYHLEGTRNNVTQETLAAFIPGQTTKEEVLRNLGEPDVVAEDGSRIAYHSIKNKAWYLFFAPYAAEYGGIKRQYVFSLTFDERNIVHEIGVQKRPMTIDGLKRVWRVARIKQYELSNDKSHFELIFLGRQISLGNFTSTDPGKSEHICFTGLLVTTPGDESFARYIQKAFMLELQRVKAFYSQGTPSLTANLDKIEYSISRRSSVPAPGFQWSDNYGAPEYESCLDLSITVRSSNGKSLTIKNEYKAICPQTLDEHCDCECLVNIFMPAVQQLIGKLTQSLEFPALINAKETEQVK